MTESATLRNLAGIYGVPQGASYSEAVVTMLDAMTSEGPGERRLHLSSRASAGEQDCWGVSGLEGSVARPRAAGAAPFLLLDGHLHNAKELAAELRMEDADSEALLLRGLEVWGDALFERISGPFALAVVDPPHDRLLLVRDAVGTRPLYWTRYGPDGVAFASLPCALTTLAGVDGTLDEAAMQRETLGLPTVPPATCFRHVFMVPRATRLSFSRGEPNSHRYWQPTRRACTAVSRAELVGEYREALRRATSGALDGSPRPVGVTLSGGLDSSAVLGMARSLVCEPSELAALTMVVPGEAAGDAPYAERVARHCQVRWHRFAAEGTALPARYLELAPNPFDASHGSMLLELAARAREAGCRIVLTGALGDFTGGCLPGWRNTLLHEGGLCRLWRELVSDPRLPLSRRLRGMVGSVLSYGAMRGWVPRALVRGLRQRARQQASAMALLTAAPEEKRRLRRALDEHRALWERPQTDLVRLTENYLDINAQQELGLVDLVARHAGLEFRSPLADRRLLELFVALPWSLRRAGGKSRIALRQAVGGLLPGTILERQEKLYPVGYFVPLWQGELADALERPSVPSARYLNREAWRLQTSRALLARDGPRTRYAPLQVLHQALVVDRWLKVQLARAGGAR